MIITNHKRVGKAPGLLKEGFGLFVHGNVEFLVMFMVVIGTFASFAVILVVSARGTVTRKERHYRLRLHMPPAADIDPARTRKTLLAPMGLIAYGVAMPFLLLKYYVIPYQVGTGEISADGSINWNTPEALIVFCVFLLHVPLAVLAMKIIRDRYDPKSKRNQKILRRALAKES